MPEFLYIVKEPDGMIRRGVQVATTATSLVNDLKDRGFLVMAVEPVKEKLDLKYLTLSYWRSPTKADIEIGMRQLGLMLRSGLSLIKSLEIVSQYTHKRLMKQVWKKTSQQIEEGASLSDAISSHPIFPNLVVQMMKVGESTGRLDEVCKRSAESLEADRQLRTQMITALAYPSIVVVMAFTVTTALLTWLVPELERALTNMGGTMPALTQSLIDLSNFVQIYGPRLILFVTLVLITSFLFRLWAPGRLFQDRLLLRFPLIGKLVRLSNTIKLSRNMATLVHSGVSLITSIKILENLLGNFEAKRVLRNAKERVTRGEEFSVTLEDTSSFMPLLTPMLAVGETSGNTFEILNEVAHFHEDILTSLIKRLGVIVEPIIIIILGGLVGYVYVAFFMAVYAVSGGA